MYSIRSIVKTACLTLSVLSLSIAVFAQGVGLNNVYYNYGWYTVQRETTKAYVDATPDKTLTNNIYAAVATGGVDNITASGVTAINDNTTVYNALATDPNTSKVFFGAKALGGIDRVRYDNTLQKWITEAWNAPGTSIYMSLTQDCALDGTVYGARVDGGIDCCNTWGCTTIDPGNYYFAVTSDPSYSVCMYGAPINGGVHMLYGPGGQWTVTQISSGAAYSALTRDRSLSLYLYGARVDGGVDRIYHDYLGWHTQTITTGNTKYIDLIYDAYFQECLFAVKVDGGIDQISFQVWDSRWVVNPIPTGGTLYGAVTNDASAGFQSYLPLRTLD